MAREGALESTFAVAAGQAPPGVHCLPPLIGRVPTKVAAAAVVNTTR